MVTTMKLTPCNFSVQFQVTLYNSKLPCNFLVTVQFQVTVQLNFFARFQCTGVVLTNSHTSRMKIDVEQCGHKQSAFDSSFGVVHSM